MPILSLNLWWFLKDGAQVFMTSLLMTNARTSACMRTLPNRAHLSSLSQRTLRLLNVDYFWKELCDWRWLSGICECARRGRMFSHKEKWSHDFLLRWLHLPAQRDTEKVWVMPHNPTERCFLERDSGKGQSTMQHVSQQRAATRAS